MRRHSYTDYVTNDALHERYSSYQERYADEPRESDKVLIDLIAGIAEAADPGRPLRLLDIGCSTGNLLRHIRSAAPTLALTGADLAGGVIDACREDRGLSGIDFAVMDMLDIHGTFDIVVANAVAVYFDPEEYEQAIASVARSLVEGGVYVAFEWLHPFAQDVEIHETSRSHPQGLKFHFRPYTFVEGCARKHGFGRVEFQPFSIPIDLPKGSTYAGNADGFEDLNSYTVSTGSGERLLFRGTLFQPWCHLVARKGGA